MNLLPFDSVKTCPACNQSVKGFRVEYSTDEVIPAGSGRFVSVHTVCAPQMPHLEKHCPHCDFGWLEHTADTRLADCDCDQEGHPDIERHASDCIGRMKALA